MAGERVLVEVRDTAPEARHHHKLVASDHRADELTLPAVLGADRAGLDHSGLVPVISTL
ncbi:hypothetical protein [Labedaea rhizosphaerae]|uniref:Uncharacterized protein n=1 Tax=Labedaea rhizosphaerae TaxID=598644 RepID=A0A4R6SES9_LABRH|nr:hypothetical protein [Labedaea rhizosphaerae]TDP97566.1 hypothetical protein EV186_103530 [Labedaea rhizosphaerae]